MSPSSIAYLATLSLSLSTLGCKRDDVPVPGPRVAPLTPAPAPAPPPASPAPSWYRAVVASPDGVEADFFLSVPAANTAGQAIFKVGGHEVRSDATFDHGTLVIPMAVHQTRVDATAAPDGSLHGTFSTSWRAFGSSKLPLTATPVAAPTPALLATVPGAGAALDLGEPRTIWRVAMKESGAAKLVVSESAPGEFEGQLFLDTGNIIYVAGNGRGDAAVLTGFDGTSGYRLDLTLDADRKHARGMLAGGSHFEWREAFTAARGPDYVYEAKPRASKPGVKVGLPDVPELASLPPGPMIVEIGGSWCSTCANAAPFMVELYRAYEARGLHMVTLLYEFTDDQAADAKQAAVFKKSYGVTWPVVAVPGKLEDFNDIMPTGLTDLNPAGFPITLFLDANRSLVAIHAGFPARSATVEFTRVSAEYRATVEKLLASSPQH